MTTLNAFDNDPNVYPKRIVYGPRQPYTGPSKDFSWIMLAVNYQQTWMIVDCSRGFHECDVFSETISNEDEGFCGVGLVLPDLTPGVYLLTEIKVGGCQPNYWGDDWDDWEIEPKKITKIAATAPGALSSNTELTTIAAVDTTASDPAAA